MRQISLIVLMTFLFALNAFSYSRYSSNESNQEKKVFFITPSNGEVVTSPFRVEFGIEGMEIVPAGVDKPMSGHHHLLINLKKLPNMKLPIPADKNHLHFGKGQTETELELPKGKHTLQLLLGNHLHKIEERSHLLLKEEVLLIPVVHLFGLEEPEEFALETALDFVEEVDFGALGSVALKEKALHQAPHLQC